MRLEEFLINYGKKKIYPMHMPGHKRNTDIFGMENPYSIDVTEAGELDNMHEPEGIIKDCYEKCRRVFGSRSSYYLINGSTCGILAGISAGVKKGGKILISRACHKSVYNAIYLRELEPVYIYPETDEAFGIYGSISPDGLSEKLEENSDVELVVITSPTYEGVVSDIKAISEICHKRGIPLMVDSAHGAHFGFSEGFPEKSIVLGADISVESIHKTLPAFTQTSLLHFNSDLISEESLKSFLTIYQTTSPSYVLMCGIDNCVEFIDSEEGKKAFYEYEMMLSDFSKKMSTLKKLRVLCKGNDSIENHPKIFDFDKGKIVISVRNSGITGAELEEILLKDYRIQLEMSLGYYGIAMTSLGDTKEGFLRLENALLELDNRLCNEKFCDNIIYKDENNSFIYIEERGRMIMKPSEALELTGNMVLIEESVGKISQEYVYAYPPGIPMIVPGEIITERMLNYIFLLEKSGTKIHDTSGCCNKWIKVVKI